MKTSFRLEHYNKRTSSFFISIIGNHKRDNKPYVAIGDDIQSFFVADKDLERFAVNILKVIGSKKLKK